MPPPGSAAEAAAPGPAAPPAEQCSEAATPAPAPPPARPLLRLWREGDSPAEDQALEPRLLDSACGWDFWRFDLRVPLAAAEQRVWYSVGLEAGSGCGSSAQGAPAAAGAFAMDVDTTAAGAASACLEEAAAAAAAAAAAGGTDALCQGPPTVPAATGAPAEGPAAGGTAAGGAAAGAARRVGSSHTTSHSFWVPGASQAMHGAYYSCSGFSAGAQECPTTLAWFWLNSGWLVAGWRGVAWRAFIGRSACQSGSQRTYCALCCAVAEMGSWLCLNTPCLFFGLTNTFWVKIAHSTALTPSRRSCEGQSVIFERKLPS